jgi:hypothetical protein
MVWVQRNGIEFLLPVDDGYTDRVTIDKRIDALTASLKLVSSDIADLKISAERHGENIRALVRIAETRKRRA